jgi:hypothetical protein
MVPVLQIMSLTGMLENEKNIFQLSTMRKDSGVGNNGASGLATINTINKVIGFKKTLNNVNYQYKT